MSGYIVICQITTDNVKKKHRVNGEMRVIMKSLWSDADSAQAVKSFGATGVNEDLALRIYTSRLLGGDGRLVLHGGGNTSVKTTMPDLFGEVQDVLCIKGSGWDMVTIEPAGFPALRLEPLLKLRNRDNLSDQEMVAIPRSCLLDPTSPNPSVEVLLHAFLHHKFVDHTHSSAILAVSDQPNGEALCQKIFGTCMAIVPYVFLWL